MKTKPLILITNRFDENLRLKLSSFKEAQFVYVKNIFADEELLSQATGVVIRSSTQVDTEFLNKAKKLEFVITATSGFDHIDLEQAGEKGVRCFHVPETQSVAAAELTILLMLGACRKFTLASHQLHKGDWQRSLLLGKQLAGQSLGIIGLGRVGQEVAKRARALGLKVCANDPYIREHDPEIPMLGFEELMRSCDIVSLHVPKTKKTRHMVKKDTLKWMSPESILINMSRGDVINEADLTEYLISTPSFCVGLDVYAREPLVTKSKLLSLTNVILTPHIGASTEEALQQSSLKAIEKVISVLKGDSVLGELPPKEPWFTEC